MGVFLSDRKADIELLGWFLEEFRHRWNGLGIPNQATIHGDTGVERITDFADAIFTQYFASPSHYQRIAAFVVLATACPCLRVTVGGNPITSQEKRRWFFSHVNFLLVPPCFKLLQESDAGAPKWPGFPPAHIVSQIVALLTLIDVGELVDAANKHSIKGATKAIVALAIILQLWVESNPQGHDDLNQLLRDIGLIS